MDTYNITDVQKLKNLFEQAFSSCSDDHPQADYDEYIALVAEGRADLLPADIRTAVLEQISYDPDSAEILKEMAANAVSKSSARPKTWYKTVSVSWAAAACLMFGLFAWCIAKPTPTVPPVKYPTASSQTDKGYWYEVNRKRLAMQAENYKWRDYALVGSVIATCLLSAAVLADRLKNKPDKK